MNEEKPTNEGQKHQPTNKHASNFYDKSGN